MTVIQNFRLNISLIIDFTSEMVFGFGGPNLCILGDCADFKKLGLSILDLTLNYKTEQFILSELPFVEFKGDKKVIFSSMSESKSLGIINEESVIFELDTRYWERIFLFFALMSWDQKTFYLNSYEDCLRDLSLEQECNLICSSEF